MQRGVDQEGEVDGNVKWSEVKWDLRFINVKEVS